NCNTALTPNPANGDQVLTAAPAYATGTLGPWYITSPTSTSVVDTGSCSASLAGLYHYTTQTSQAKEGTSQVDMGFHYVALDGSGSPVDTDVDGISDYLEDSNGDGKYDNGDMSDWQVYDLPNAYRGKALLVVDRTVAADPAVSSRIDRLTQDLV